MPTFCRHNRFVERCPICSKTLPGNEPRAQRPRREPARRSAAPGARRSSGGDRLRVRREGRELEDGYRNELVPGLRASADARRLAVEIEFSSRRLAALAAAPPGLYGEALRAGAGGDLERASWICLLLAYLCPSEDETPFAAAEAVLDAAPAPRQLGDGVDRLLDEVELGPRSSHERGRGAQTLQAYAGWLQRNGGSQAAALRGDSSWTPERRFARLFERLALPGLSRAARYELLLTLGRLGCYELSADSLQLTATRGAGSEDAVTVAAKRVFGIGDPLLLDRRAAALAEEAGVGLEALDLALANWLGPQRATMGIPALPAEAPPLAAAEAALGL